MNNLETDLIIGLTYCLFKQGPEYLEVYVLKQSMVTCSLYLSTAVGKPLLV